ncbi:MerR family transcriptional regulator [Paractinoplanes hotanensis]|uniref:MerR family transcriptional regulator n=1 Tax=Paractinoplanes hotanensis TaxID=2906497 RepID=A0ABT0Y8A5_9ACTN|nr:MerR family transcriptional regulator [Actinoplanes hotanensis]MCM4082282.1 MerR family transcriptional regulator [Actinoplanes hotanensis]
MQRPLTVQEMSRKSGFTEPTLRYYERIGLLGPVGRDPASGHRRYEDDAVGRVAALACLRSSGMTVDGMRAYVELLGRGDEAAEQLRDLFTERAGQLAAEIARLRLRHEYLELKARLWQARMDGDAEAEAGAVERLEEILSEL